MKNEIPDKNLFMMCRALNPDALSELSKEYHVRTCRKNELDIWKAMPFDDEKSAKEYKGFYDKNTLMKSTGIKNIYFFRSVYLFVIKMTIL